MMNNDNVFTLGMVIIFVSIITWFGFNVYKNNVFSNEQEIKKLTLDADQLCALQPITNQTEFCRDRINLFNQTPVK